MLNFKLDATRRFQVRAVMVAFCDQSVLVHRAENNSHWALPGGRGEFGETVARTVVREAAEELGVPTIVERLLWIDETVFGDPTVDRVHELAFYFLVRFPDDHAIYQRNEPFTSYDNNVRLTFRWVPVAALPALPLYPTWLAPALTRPLPPTPVPIESIPHPDPE